MKKAIMLCVTVLMTIAIISSSVEAESIMPFTGLKWGDHSYQLTALFGSQVKPTEGHDNVTEYVAKISDSEEVTFSFVDDRLYLVQIKYTNLMFTMEFSYLVIVDRIKEVYGDETSPAVEENGVTATIWDLEDNERLIAQRFGEDYIMVSYMVTGGFEPPYLFSFIGIDWRISQEEFNEALKQNGLELVYQYDGIIGWSPFEGKERDYDYSMYWEIPSCRYRYSTSKNFWEMESFTTVGGYEVDTVMAYFRATYSLSEMTYGAPYELARIEYWIDIPDLLKNYEVYNDLKAKLTNLYGEPSGEEDHKAWWYAEDGSGAYLHDVSSDYNGRSGYNYIALEYGLADEQQYFADINLIREWQKEQERIQIEREKEELLDSISDDYGGL